MLCAHRAAVNGAQLDEINERIVIRGTESGAGKGTVTAVSTGRGDGSRITGRRRESLEAQVRFAMDIRKRDMQERAELLESVFAWAAAAEGGTLTFGHKPGRRLRVDEVETPGEGDVWKWLDEYTITFRARAVPYWEQENAISAQTATGTSQSGAITVAGSAETVANVTIENMSGAVINTMTVTIGGKSMAFEGLGLGAGQSLIVDHTRTNGRYIQRIRIGTQSVMAKRTSASADEFIINPGSVSFSFSAQRACRLTVSCRGRYL